MKLFFIGFLLTCGLALANNDETLGGIELDLFDNGGKFSSTSTITEEAEITGYVARCTKAAWSRLYQNALARVRTNAKKECIINQNAKDSEELLLEEPDYFMSGKFGDFTRWCNVRLRGWYQCKF